MRTSPIAVAGGLAAAYLIFGLLSLGRFGVTWDEPAPDHFYVGDLYLDTLRSGDFRSLTAAKIGRSMENYGPVFDLIGALDARLLHKRWHILPEDDARHLHLVFTASLTVFFVCLLAGRAWSLPAGIFSALFLCAFPRFVADSFNNPKDNPVAFVYTLCFYLYYRRITTDNKVYSILIALAAGLGLATRATFVINPVIILIYTILYSIVFSDRRLSLGKRLVHFWDLWLAMVLSLPLGMLLWPYLWDQPLVKLKAIGEFYFYHKTQAPLRILYGGKRFVPGVNMPWHYAPVMLLITTPLITLGAALCGLGRIALRQVGAASRRDPCWPGSGLEAPPTKPSSGRSLCVSVGAASSPSRIALRDPPRSESDQVCGSGVSPRSPSGRKAFGLLLVCWIVLGILPFVLPGQRVYDGVRHFLYVAPAICLLAGIGLDGIFRWLSRRAGMTIGVLALVALYLLLGLNVFSYHPDYTVYYNALVGGPRGAFGAYLLDYWGNSYKRGMAWINRHAPPGSSVLVMVAPQIARFYARGDLVMLGPEELDADPYLRFDYSMYAIRDLEPLRNPSRGSVFEIAVHGQPILKIHRWR